MWPADWAPGQVPGAGEAGEAGEAPAGRGSAPADEAAERARRDPDSTPVLDGFLHLVDMASERLLDRPFRPRLKLTPGGLARGEVDVVGFEVPAVLAAGLVLDRVAVRAERVRVAPGLPPRLRAGPVRISATTTQDHVDRWARSVHLPLRLELGRDGVAITAAVAGIRVGRLITELDVSRGLLRLRPRHASFVGLPAPLVSFLRGYLPLPPLPRGARLVSVGHAEGELSATFEIAQVDEPMTPEVARRVASLLRVPLAWV